MLSGYIIKRINKNDQCGDPSEELELVLGSSPPVVERITIIMCPSTTLGEYTDREVVRAAQG